MIVHEIHNNGNKHVISLLEKEFSQIKNTNIVKNYHPDYSNDPANIFYILNDINGRYSKGCYYVCEDKDGYVCSAGYNEYDLDKDIALALTRAYVATQHRTKYYMGEYILPRIIDATKKYKHLYITADSYNSAIYQWFVRANQGKSPGMFNDWPEIYRNFKPIGKQIIYYTEQFVAEYQEIKA